MHAHGVEVLDRADDDAVVLAVAHHLHLVFFPADQRFLDQQFTGGRSFQPAGADLDEFFHVVGDAAAGAAHGEGWADDDREAEAGLDLLGFFHAVRDAGTCRAEADPGHGLLELLAVLGLVDGFLPGADHFHAELFQHSMPGEVERAIQCGLPPHGRQQRVGALLLDDLRHHLPGDRLDVGHVRHVGVGHDGRRVGVDQDDLVAFFLQRLAGLCAGIVELARLADDDGPRADDKDAVDVCSFWHVSGTSLPSSTRSGRTNNRRRAGRGSLPGGPGRKRPAHRCGRCPAGCCRTARRAWA